MDMYVTGEGDKLVQEDDYQEGVVENGFHSDVSISFEGDTVKDVLEDISTFFQVDIKDIEVNAGGEDGLIRFDILEDGDSEPASESDIKRWKNGEQTLYSCVYEFQLYKQEETRI